MVNAAKNGKWVWFVLVFLWSPISLVVYLLFGYERRKKSSFGSYADVALRREPRP